MYKCKTVFFPNEILISFSPQHEFLTGVSTADATNNLTEQLFKDINSKNRIPCVFFELRKDFDTVKHTILLRKLEEIGIRQLSLEKFRNYLINRQQFARLNDI